MVISAVRDRLGMGPRYRYRDIISIEPSGRSSLKATTTFFLSTSAVPTCSVLSSPSQFLSSTLGKRLSSFRWSLLVSFFLDTQLLLQSPSLALPSVWFTHSGVTWCNLLWVCLSNETDTRLNLKLKAVWLEILFFLMIQIIFLCSFTAVKLDFGTKTEKGEGYYYYPTIRCSIFLFSPYHPTWNITQMSGSLSL